VEAGESLTAGALLSFSWIMARAFRTRLE